MNGFRTIARSRVPVLLTTTLLALAVGTVAHIGTAAASPKDVGVGYENYWEQVDNARAVCTPTRGEPRKYRVIQLSGICYNDDFNRLFSLVCDFGFPSLGLSGWAHWASEEVVREGGKLVAPVGVVCEARAVANFARAHHWW